MELSLKKMQQRTKEMAAQGPPTKRSPIEERPAIGKMPRVQALTEKFWTQEVKDDFVQFLVRGGVPQPMAMDLLATEMNVQAQQGEQKVNRWWRERPASATSRAGAGTATTMPTAIGAVGGSTSSSTGGKRWPIGHGMQKRQAKAKATAQDKSSHRKRR